MSCKSFWVFGTKNWNICANWKRATFQSIPWKHNKLSTSIRQRLNITKEYHRPVYLTNFGITNAQEKTAWILPPLWKIITKPNQIKQFVYSRRKHPELRKLSSALEILGENKAMGMCAWYIFTHQKVRLEPILKEQILKVKIVFGLNIW